MLFIYFNDHYSFEEDGLGVLESDLGLDFSNIFLMILVFWGGKPQERISFFRISGEWYTLPRWFITVDANAEHHQVLYFLYHPLEKVIITAPM